MLRSKKTSAVLALMIVALAAAVVDFGLKGGRSETVGAGGEGVRFVGSAPTQASEHSWATDERFVVGAADDVFVGRVLRAEDRLTSAAGSAAPTPESQFAIEVLQNVKGRLRGTVTVNQGGGFVEYSADRDYPEQGIREGDRVRQLSLVNGVPLLEAGKEYLFVTTHDAENGWHEFVSPGLARLEVEDRAQREALVENFEEAEREQIDPNGFAGASGVAGAPGVE